jgi:hypothetical protein
MLDQLKCVEKCGALIVLRHKVNVTVELIDNQFADDKPQANAVRIDFPFLVFEGTKQFEEFVLILDLNPFAIVNHREPYLIV